jgi:hypothetical protein
LASLFVRVSAPDLSGTALRAGTRPLRNSDYEIRRRIAELLFADVATLKLLVDSVLLSGRPKCFCDFGRAETICDPPQVVGHDREAHFDLGTGQSTHQQPRMSENAVFDCSVRVLDGASTQSHNLWRNSRLHTVQGFLIKVTS